MFGGQMMKFSYKKLWKLLIDRDIRHNELIEKTGISRSTFYKLKRDENVTTDILLKYASILIVTYLKLWK